MKHYSGKPSDTIELSLPSAQARTGPLSTGHEENRTPITLASSVLSEAVFAQGGHSYTGLTTRMCYYIIHTT